MGELQLGLGVWHHLAVLALPLAVAEAMGDGDCQNKEADPAFTASGVMVGTMCWSGAQGVHISNTQGDTMPVSM